MRKIKPIQVTYQYYNHFLPHILSKKRSSQKQQQQQPDLQTCLNNSFQLFADTLMSKVDDITKIAEKSPSRTKAKAQGNRLRKGRQSDDERASPEPLSESESELGEQVNRENRKLRPIPLELRLAKNAKKGQVVSLNINMMKRSFFMPMMTVDWQIT